MGLLVQGDAFNVLEGISAYDSWCGPLKDIQVSPTSIDTNVVGVYELEYTVSDLAGNMTLVKRYVTVNPKSSIINHAPTIQADDKTLNVGESFDPLKDVQAYDKEDGVDVKLEVLNNTVDTSKAGTYEVTYKAVDSQDAAVTKTIQVHVVLESLNKPNTSDMLNPMMYLGLAAFTLCSIVMIKKRKEI